MSLPATAPVTSVDAAKADSVAAYLLWRSHDESCFRCRTGRECLNGAVLFGRSSAADWRLARERELAKGLAA